MAGSEQGRRVVRALVIFNPAAGSRRRAALAQALDHLAGQGVAATVHETSGPGDGEKAAAAVTRAGFDLVVAAGGDGTLNEVVNGVGPAAPPVAVLPLGTANVLAAEIGLPRRLAAVARVIAAGRTLPFRPGLVNGRRFALMAGVGLDAEAVAAVTVRQKRLLGRGAYAGQALLALCRGGRSPYRIEIDGRGHVAGAAIVTRGRFYGGAYLLAPEASLFRPALWACLALGLRRRDYLRYGAALLCGRLAAQPDVVIHPASRVTIPGPAGAPVQCDGNIVCRLPATIELAATPIPLVVPAELYGEVADQTG
jgi:diacylglycerol kinase (ATP)